MKKLQEAILWISLIFRKTAWLGGKCCSKYLSCSGVNLWYTRWSCSRCKSNGNPFPRRNVWTSASRIGIFSVFTTFNSKYLVFFFSKMRLSWMDRCLSKYLDAPKHFYWTSWLFWFIKITQYIDRNKFEKKIPMKSPRWNFIILSPFSSTCFTSGMWQY